MLSVGKKGQNDADLFLLQAHKTVSNGTITSLQTTTAYYYLNLVTRQEPEYLFFTFLLSVCLLRSQLLLLDSLKTNITLLILLI